jgi:hypothetical protein
MNRRRFLSSIAGLPLLLLLPWRKPAEPNMSYPELDANWWLCDNEESVMSYIAAVEQERGVSPVIGSRVLCQETGTYYEEIVLAPDGEIWGVGSQLSRREAARFDCPEEAWLRWTNAFSNYCSEHVGKLHWRVKPELHGAAPDFEDLGYCVYARLVIG